MLYRNRIILDSAKEPDFEERVERHNKIIHEYQKILESLTLIDDEKV